MITPRTDGELLDAAAERTAILVIALRHLVAAHHRTHADPCDPSWQNCAQKWCMYAHEALDGRFTLAPADERGRVVALVKKEAS